MAEHIVSTLKRTLAAMLASSTSFSDEEPVSPPAAKRRRRFSAVGSNAASAAAGTRTPTLVQSQGPLVRREDASPSPPTVPGRYATSSSSSSARISSKRRRIQRAPASSSSPPPLVPQPPQQQQRYTRLVQRQPPLKPPQTSALLKTVPHDVLGHCLSFVSTPHDRFALQTTCRQFHASSNGRSMLRSLDLGGSWWHDDDWTGRGGRGSRGVLTEDDTTASACRKLSRFAVAGNLQAIYMLGMIRSYCHENVEEGIALLRVASTRGCDRSLYALALILRDSHRSESKRLLQAAASHGYLPAWQELLPAPEMKVRYGDLDASVLRKYLDPPCLNRLLGRHYLHCEEVRDVQTSHCWNPLCGRWAFKANSNGNNVNGAAAAASSHHGHHHHQHHHPRRGQHRRRGDDVHHDESEASTALSSSSASVLAAAAAAERDDDRATPSGVWPMHRLVSSSSLGVGSFPAESDSGRRDEGNHVASSPSSSSWALALFGSGGVCCGDASSAAAAAAGATTASVGGQRSSTSAASYVRVSRMKMCSSCRRAKYCSKLCQVYDWRSGRHKMECQYL